MKDKVLQYKTSYKKKTSDDNEENLYEVSG